VGCSSLVLERFTESARQGVVTANQAARDLNHGQIDTEHELFALLTVRSLSSSVTRFVFELR
jgi:hypothetical protein